MTSSAARRDGTALRRYLRVLGNVILELADQEDPSEVLAGSEIIQTDAPRGLAELSADAFTLSDEELQRAWDGR